MIGLIGFFALLDLLIFRVFLFHASTYYERKNKNECLFAYIKENKTK